MHHHARLQLTGMIAEIFEVALRVHDLIPVHRRQENARLRLQLANDLSEIIRTVAVQDAQLEYVLTPERSDDIRDAPALDVARMLQAEGADVRVYDPQAMANARRAYPDLTYSDSVFEAARDAQVVVLLTEWRQFRALDPHRLAELVAARSMVDGRHALDPTTWRDAGWEYRALGRAS